MRMATDGNSPTIQWIRVTHRRAKAILVGQDETGGFGRRERLTRFGCARRAVKWLVGLPLSWGNHACIPWLCRWRSDQRGW